MSIFFSFVLFFFSAISIKCASAFSNKSDIFFPPNRCNWALDPMSDLCARASRRMLTLVGEMVLRNPIQGTLQEPPWNPLLEGNANKGHLSPADRADVSSKVSCAIKKFGGANPYELCDVKGSPNDGPCVYYSFGISGEVAFETELSNSWKCKGYLLDPTVNYKAQIDTWSLFFSIGANMLTKYDDYARGRIGKLQTSWDTVSLPKLQNFLGHKNINLVKMDCEGCEYAIARDVALENPRFFRSVDQFVMEVHSGKSWMHSAEHDFFLVQKTISGCAPSDEKAGCRQEIIDSKFPCGQQQQCHVYLFKKKK